MNAIDILKADHNRVRGLFSLFKAAKERDDRSAMADFASRIFEQLDVHTKIEESTFYPEVRKASDEINEMVAEGVEEHHVVDQLIEECKGLEPGAEEWTAKLTVLIENVEHHADEEESDMFPKVRSALGNDRLDRLGDALTAEKKKLGAPTAEDAIDLTKETLLDKARDQEIPGRSSMDHDELAATVDPRY